jgi:hypothetical protein
MSSERIEELYQTEMSEEAKNVWYSCIEWLVNYYHCSKQLADLRMREWNNEYQHCPMKTVGKNRSEETRKKRSESHKGKTLSDETRAKISAAGKGKHWYNNGIINMFAKSCPEGFVKGRLYGKKI